MFIDHHLVFPSKWTNAKKPLQKAAPCSGFFKKQRQESCAISGCPTSTVGCRWCINLLPGQPGGRAVASKDLCHAAPVKGFGRCLAPQRFWKDIQTQWMAVPYFGKFLLRRLKKFFQEIWTGFKSPIAASMGLICLYRYLQLNKKNQPNVGVYIYIYDTWMYGMGSKIMVFFLESSCRLIAILTNVHRSVHSPPTAQWQVNLKIGPLSHPVCQPSWQVPVFLDCF